ncbi:MAG TPA: phosphatase PAP2 family protein, partial [Sedimenticola sp.]|nr:phosphatase PAP2 family protein [Sedimenticola sp.]
GKSVAIGRFFGPVRAVIPLVAGMMEMPPGRFFVANLASALVWAPAYLLPGMVFGASMELASQVAVRLVVVVLLLLTAAWLTFLLLRRAFRLLQPHARALVQGLLRWGEAHPRVREITEALADPAHPEARGLSTLAGLLVLGIALFTLILGWVLRGPLHQGIDYTVLEGLQSLRNPWADNLMVVITGLADPWTMTLFPLAVLGLLLWQRRYRAALHWLAAAAFCLAAVPLLKYGLRIPRPEVVAGARESYSFPSGHTLWASVMYGFLAVMVARATPERWRWAPYTLAGLVTVAVAFSRLYLGVHWLSDILASITLGVVWISALGIAYRRHSQDGDPSPWPLAAVAGGVVILTLGTQAALHQQRNLARYAPLVEQRLMAESRWWGGGWAELPRVRLDTRRRNQPLNIQYAGSLEEARALLAPAGWRPAERLEWGNLLKLLSPDLPLQQLPVLPQVHDGRHDSLALEKPLPGDRRAVLRLWSSRVTLTPSRRPLWLGSVGEQRQVRLLGLLTFAATDDRFQASLDLLRRDSSAFPARRSVDSGQLLLLDAGRPDLSAASPAGRPAAPAAAPGRPAPERPDAGTASGAGVRAAGN